MKLTDTARMVLVRAEVFMDLPNDYLASIRQYLEEQHLAAGHTVFREGEVGDKLFVVRRGSVRLQKVRDGVLYEVGRRGPGDMLGETALIDSSPRNVTVVCVGACDFFTLSREAFYEILSRLPAVATKILKVLTARIRDVDAARLQELESKNTALEQARDRLKQLLAHLESTNDQLEAAMSSHDCFLSMSPLPMVLTDAGNNVRLTNAAAVRKFGEARSRNIWEWLNTANQESTAAIDATAGDGSTWEGELDLIGPGDVALIVKVMVVPVTDGNAGQTARLWIMDDRTSERLIEKQTCQATWLAAKGEMAAEIAHELNNYLAVLSGNSELLEMHLGNGNSEKAGLCVSNIRQSLDRIRVFTDEMLGARDRSGSRTSWNISELVANQIAFLRPQRMFKKVVIKTELADGVLPFLCDASNIQQIVYNLLLNSAEALAETSDSHSTIWVGTEFLPMARTVRIRIADDGPGIPPELKPKLFRRRVSTKSSDRGFGLLIVDRLVSGLGGRVSAGSRSGGVGTEFIVELPIVTTPASQ